MKVLLSAYSCEPGRGSEPGVGWNVLWEIAKYHQVWVLTRPDESQAAIEAELQRHPNPNLHFVYFTLPVWGSGWRWGPVAFLIHYYLWQVQAYFVARDLHRQIGFDLAHHVTFVRYATPSFLALLPIPFLWGPVGGGESAPAPFWRDFSFRNRLYETSRLIARWQGEWDPFTRMTARRSRRAWATTEDTAARLRRIGATDVQVLSQLGLSEQELQELARANGSPAAGGPIFVSIGRLLHWKGFHLGLRAFALANLPEARYCILGKGPQQERLQALAQQLGIADRVRFLSEVPRQEVFAQLRSATALIHPSLHESGGGVCLEAMAAGCPVICLNLGGPGAQVTDETGFRISPTQPDEVVADMAAAMRKLAQDPALWAELSQASQRHVRERFTWEQKGKTMIQVYERILASSQPEAAAPIMPQA